MIYRVIRKIVKIALQVFFRKIVVTGSGMIPDKGPLIIAANHPNTFMDPMIVAAITRQRIGFVANAGIFVNRAVTKLFGFFHVIPIYRKKDVAGGQQPDNTRSFKKCHEYLYHGGTILIFPEGSSYYELNLREIKTGTARIALSFEALQDFKGSLSILPVAIDYSDAIQFRSMVSVTIGTPIPVDRYKESFYNDEVTAVRHLTEAIRSELAQHIPQTTGKDQEEYLIKAHKFYTAYYEPDADLYENPRRSLELRKQLSEALHVTREHNGPLYDGIRQKVLDFFETLRSERITTGLLSDWFLNKNKWLVCSGYFFEILLLLPFYLFGLFTNYLPYILPSKIFELSKLEISYKTPVQLVAGLVTFPVFYFLELLLFRHFVSSDWRSILLALAALPLSGFLAMFCWTEIRRFIRVLRFYFFMSPKKKQELLQLRNDILRDMHTARSSLS